MKTIYYFNQRVMNGTVTLKTEPVGFLDKKLAEITRKKIIEDHKNSPKLFNLICDEVSTMVIYESEEETGFQKPLFKVGDKIKYVGEREEFDIDEHIIKSVLPTMYITTLDKKIPFKFQDNYKLI